MFFSFELTIPANTLKATPVTQRLKLSEGVIHLVDIEFRSGTDFTVGVRILQGGHQVYPSNPDGDLKADGRAVIFPDHYELKAADNELVVQGYSPGSTYAHVVYIKLGVLRQDELNPSYTTDSLLMKFLRMVGVMK